MWLSAWALTTTLLLSGAQLATSSALIHIPSLGRRDEWTESISRALKSYEGELERRSPSNSSPGGDLSLSAPDVEKNATTLDACTSAMQRMTSVSNEPGFAACYNVLDWNPNVGNMFQADLRLFQFSNATGEFANIPMNGITIHLDYPNSTQFSILTNAKRSLNYLNQRQIAPTEIQQYSLVGNFKMSIDFKKLNNTQLMSLLIPQISLQATVNGTAVSVQMSPSDSAYFVTGQFKDLATPQSIAIAANPATAAAAIAAAKGFVLPGTTFGIFPTGLIITGTWCFLFILAFGLGTAGRIRHREIYRKRVAATSGRDERK